MFQISDTAHCTPVKFNTSFLSGLTQVSYVSDMAKSFPVMETRKLQWD